MDPGIEAGIDSNFVETIRGRYDAAWSENRYERLISSHQKICKPAVEKKERSSRN